jgi:cell division septal protein FtsQ
MNLKDVWRPLALLVFILFCALAFFNKLYSPKKNEAKIEGLHIISNVPVLARWVSEVLHLSVDEPTYFYDFDSHLARHLLLSTYVVKEAKIKLIRPNLLNIQLDMRVPVAQIADFSNTAVDDQGYLFPILPVYVDRKLPKIYLGELCPQPVWGQCIGAKWPKIMMDFPLLEAIDCANLHKASLGERELVIHLSNGSLVRLPDDQLGLYYDKIVQLNNQMPAQAKIIDMRIPDIAYVKKIED